MMRVRAILWSVVWLGVASPASAQLFTYGAKAGVNFSTLAVDPNGGDDGYTNQLGLVAGGFAVKRLTGRLDLQPEGLYSGKGASTDVGGTDAHARLDYIDVPVLVRYRLQGSGHRTIYLFGGPSFNVLLRARIVSNLGNTKIDQDVTDDVERLELAAVAGGGVTFGRWLVEGRYSYGFSDTDKDTSDDVKVRNRVAAVLGGFRF